jgi:hypothetical protein
MVAATAQVLCKNFQKDPTGCLPESVVLHVSSEGVILIDAETSFTVQLYQWAQITDYSAGGDSFSFEVSASLVFEFDCANSRPLEDLFLEHDTDNARCYRWHDPTGGLPEDLDFGVDSAGLTITDPTQPGVVLCSFSWLMIPEGECWGKSRSDGEEMDLFGFKATGLPFVVECDSFNVLTDLFASGRTADPSKEKERKKKKKERKKRKKEAAKKPKEPKQKKAGTGRKSSSANAVGGSTTCVPCNIVQDPTAILDQEMLIELGKFGIKFTETESKVVKLLYQWAQLSTFQKQTAEGFTFTVDVGFPAVPHKFDIQVASASLADAIEQLFRANHQNMIQCYKSVDPTGGALPDELCLQGTLTGVSLIDPSQGHTQLFIFTWADVSSCEVIRGGSSGGGRDSMDKFAFVTPEGGAGAGGTGQWRFELQCEDASVLDAMFTRRGESVSTGRERTRKEHMARSAAGSVGGGENSRKSTRSIEGGGAGAERKPRKAKETTPPPPPTASPAPAPAPALDNATVSAPSKGAVKPSPPPPSASTAAPAPAKGASPPKGKPERISKLKDAQTREGAADPVHTLKVGPNGERDLVIRIVTWNLGNAAPKLDEVVDYFLDVSGEDEGDGIKHPVDILAIGCQECAYTVKEGEFAGQEQAEHMDNLIEIAMRAHSIGDANDYCMVATRVLWEMRIYVLARKEHASHITDVETAMEATGFAHLLGNKGGLSVKIVAYDTSLAFLSCHLAAHQGKTKDRNGNLYEILGQGGCRMGQQKLEIVNQFHHIFWFGDLNYRIDIPEEKYIEFLPHGLGELDDDMSDKAMAHAKVTGLIEKQMWDALYAHDQLQKVISGKVAMSFFEEGKLIFRPTFKVRRQKGIEYLDQRIPAYCDRVLWRSLPPVKDDLEIHAYSSLEQLSTSDHKAVFATFRIKARPRPVPRVPPWLLTLQSTAGGGDILPGCCFLVFEEIKGGRCAESLPATACNLTRHPASHTLAVVILTHSLVSLHHRQQASS